MTIEELNEIVETGDIDEFIRVCEARQCKELSKIADRITATRGTMEPGPEGCLSVPGRRGEVLRYRDIDISYISPETLQTVTERVEGFTAVIFQHECDHLDGVLYIDKLVEE